MTLTKTLMATTVLTFVAGLAHADGHMASEMTIVSWGGAYSKSQQLAYHDPYAAMTGVKVINDDSSAEAVSKLRAMNEAGNVTWDVVDVVAADALRLCRRRPGDGIDPDTMLADAPDGTKASEDFGDLLVGDCFIPQIVYSTTFGYRTDLVGDTPPTSVCSVFDTEALSRQAFAGKAPDCQYGMGSAGVTASQLTTSMTCSQLKLDKSRLWPNSARSKTTLSGGSAGADTPQLLADGEIVMGSTYNGRLFSVIEEQNQPVGMLWDQQMFDLDGWIIPTGLSPERQARALDYIKFATDTQRLADQAKYISYGPARKSSAPLVGKHAELGIDMAPHMPTDPKNAQNTFLYNYEFWADYRDDIDANSRHGLQSKPLI